MSVCFKQEAQPPARTCAQFKRKYVAAIVVGVVCIFNFFVLPSSYHVSLICLFSPCHHFRGLRLHPGREPATAGC